MICLSNCTTNQAYLDPKLSRKILREAAQQRDEEKAQEAAARRSQAEYVP